MQPFDLLDALIAHQPFNALENTHRLWTLHAVSHITDVFNRKQVNPGHVTGSAWIILPDYSEFLTIMHPVRKQPMMPGGHSDGDPDTLAVAYRETEEEVGLNASQLTHIPWKGGAIFDVDTHQIPANPARDEPEHLHLDIRFLFSYAGPKELVSPESIKIGWNTLIQGLAMFPPDGGRHRCIKKIAQLANAA